MWHRQRITAALATLAVLGLLSGLTAPLFAQDIKRKIPKDVKLKNPNIELSLDAAPAVRDWKPRERAYPGQSLFIKGGPYRISDLRAELVTSHGRIELPRGPANDSTAVFRITDEMYTGRPGARLVIKHVHSSQGSGSEERVLDANYMVLNRVAVFRGPSFWRQTTSTASPVLTEGTVTLRIQDLEFADAGTYTYHETVPLLTVVEELDSECKEGKLFAPARRLDIRNRTFSRSGTWKRLADGRVQLDDAGVDPRTPSGGTVVLADLSHSAGTVRYETYAPITDDQKPRTVPPYCFRCYSKLVGIGLLVGLELVCNDRPLPKFPLRVMEWSLQRLDGI